MVRRKQVVVRRNKTERVRWQTVGGIKGVMTGKISQKMNGREGM